MKKVAIVGVGPTGIYTFHALVERGEPLEIELYEQAEEAGVGMPYNSDNNADHMLANIASIEIPPIYISYLTWLQNQSHDYLARFQIERTSLHERQFLPRVILGDYYRDRFLAIVDKAQKAGFTIRVHESSEVTDLRADPNGVSLWINHASQPVEVDFAAIATGHLWPETDAQARKFFPSPWTGLMDAQIGACRVGILGTSLSAIDAAMAVASQHGTFTTNTDHSLQFTPKSDIGNLKLTLMSRSGVLPEADFYCPLPYESLNIATPEAIEDAIAQGQNGLLDRIFQLIAQQLQNAAPGWCQQIALATLNADTFPEVYFTDRLKHDPFDWARRNLVEVERNKQEQHTVVWRYTLLRLHEVIEEIVPHLDTCDEKRFRRGLKRVFIDNYAAIPSESVRRLLALHDAGLIEILALGADYERTNEQEMTVIYHHGQRIEFDVFIDARGQRALQSKDIPFPTLRDQLLACGDEIPDIGEDYTLQAPENARNRIAFGGLPWLMHDRPFIQGLVVSAEIGAAMAKALTQQAQRRRHKLWNSDDMD
ncbi:FAD-NAD(P)-binding protein [Citrobacter freundii]|uniref:FAD-NAD(P)-binding protein n=1 Tax=Citrobacter TaxID=544 RepID=UPI001883BEC2|nr:FAD-NAD(P)-binding protein [Citrobacter sp. Cpo090]MBF0031283.1 FAD-NAD(P)-binding protein [Citrobacter freundii]MDM2846670.1 FAD-NAD(P)-binding protein [Citrobacter sp. Cpo090]